MNRCTTWTISLSQPWRTPRSPSLRERRKRNTFFDVVMRRRSKRKQRMCPHCFQSRRINALIRHIIFSLRSIGRSTKIALLFTRHRCAGGKYPASAPNTTIMRWTTFSSSKTWSSFLLLVSFRPILFPRSPTRSISKRVNTINENILSVLDFASWRSFKWSKTMTGNTNACSSTGHWSRLKSAGNAISIDLSVVVNQTINSCVSIINLTRTIRISPVRISSPRDISFGQTTRNCIVYIRISIISTSSSRWPAKWANSISFKPPRASGHFSGYSGRERLFAILSRPFLPISKVSNTGAADETIPRETRLLTKKSLIYFSHFLRNAERHTQKKKREKCRLWSFPLDDQGELSC